LREIYEEKNNKFDARMIWFWFLEVASIWATWLSVRFRIAAKIESKATSRIENPKVNFFSKTHQNQALG
jgi:hypothetical protein